MVPDLYMKVKRRENFEDIYLKDIFSFFSCFFITLTILKRLSYKFSRKII